MPVTLGLAADLIALFRVAQGQHPRRNRGRAPGLGGGPDRLPRENGGWHTCWPMTSAPSRWESPLNRLTLRQRVFALSATSVPSHSAESGDPSQRWRTRSPVSCMRDIGPEQVRAWLYADLPEAHVLTSFEAPTPEVAAGTLQLAQAQGRALPGEPRRHHGAPQ